MDSGFRGNKLLISLTPEETSALVSTIPDDVLKAEAIKRGFEISGSIGVAALGGALESTPGETDVQLERYNGIIRRPIHKYEFMSYVDSHLADGDELKLRAQKGAIGRTWNGFIGLHKTSNDFGRKINVEHAERITGVKSPEFEDIAFKREPSLSSVERLSVDVDHTDGLDLDQAARYLIAISDRIRERHAADKPLDRALAGDVASRLLPTYTFLGCQLLCDFIAVTAKREGGLPEDIDAQLLEQASKNFAILASQTSNNFSKVS